MKTVLLFLSIFIYDTGETTSKISSVKFSSIQKCENFVLYVSQGVPYHRGEDGSLILLDPSSGNIITARCYEG